MSSNQSPREIITDAIIADSVPEVQRAISTWPTRGRPFDASVALRSAIKHASPNVAAFLLDEGGATLEGLSPDDVSKAAAWRDGSDERRGDGEEDWERVERTWEVLIGRGWGIDARGEVQVEGGDGIAFAPGESLLSQIVWSDRLVRFCLNHNASITDPPDLHPFYTRPLLDAAASRASPSTFKLLREKGAQLTRRVLHRAVESAAYAEDAKEGEGDGRGKVEERMEVVKYLVEVEGCDINAMDVAEGKEVPNHWGVPMAYAVHTGKGIEVVKWLLEKGADPRIKDGSGYGDVLSLARDGRARAGVLDVLQEWERTHPMGEQ